MDTLTTRPECRWSPSTTNDADNESGSTWMNSSLNTTWCKDAIDVQLRINPYPPWVVIFLWLLTALFSVETILGNLLVLLAYKLERNIRRQLSNKFIVSLAITDLIIGMEGFPLLTVYVVGRELWPLGHLLCQFWLFLDYTLCLVSILNVLLITVDRYGSVCYPAKYRVWQTRSRVRMFIFMSWIVPCILFGMMIFAWEPMTGQGMDNSGKCYAPFLDDPYVNMAMYIIYYWTTLVAMSVLYRGIHTAAKALEDKSKARERQTIALLLGQRCMAQVGVGMLLHSSASDEDDNMESFFHAQTTVDGGYGTDEAMTTAELLRDHPSVKMASATVSSTVEQSGGYEELGSDSDERTPLNIPAIVTPRVSIASIGSVRVQDLPRTLLYSEFGQGDDEEAEPEHEEDVSFSLAPLLERVGDSQSKPATTSSTPSKSPSRAKIFTTTMMRRSSSYRRVLAPMHSYGGVASLASKTKRTRLICSLSLDEEQIGAATRASQEVKKPTPVRQAWMTPKRNGNGIAHDSTCSLDFYDSTKGSVASLYGDTSLRSVFDFDAFVGPGNPAEAPSSMETSLVVVPGGPRQPNGHVTKALLDSPCSSSSFCSASGSVSIKSPQSPSTGDLLPVHAAVVSSSSSPAKLIHLADECPRQLSTRPSVQIKISPDTDLLTPIIEEEKSTATTNAISRPGSAAPESPRRQSSSAALGSRGRQGTKRHRADQKVIHLTVPGSSASSKPGVLDRRKGKKAVADRGRTGTEGADWNRASWQSTTSSIYCDGKKRNSRRFTRSSNIDDDEDSGASNANRDETRPGSAAEDYPSETRKGSGHWLMNLFNNPTSILNRKRKVTKAERRARKAFRTITVIVGTFALFWSPYYIVATIYGFCPDCVPAPLFLTSYYLCYLNSSVNPFAYAFANRLFRKTFIRILRGDLRRT